MEYVLKFTQDQMLLLSQAIGELPHKHAAPLVQAINEQIISAREAIAPREPERDDPEDSRN